MMCERKILVVDDEVDLLQMIETTLNTEAVSYTHLTLPTNSLV